MAAKTAVRTRTTRAAKSTESTEKKAPQPIVNRFRGKCAECGEWVGGGDGIVTPPAAKGEKWVTHHGEISSVGTVIYGPCPSATVKNRRINTPKKEDTMPVRRTRKTAAPKIEKFSTEDITALSLRELRDLATRLDLDEKMKKIGILNEMIEKGHLIEEGEESTPAPAKKTTPRKRAAAPVESASDENEEAAGDDDMSSALAEMLKVIKGQISSGALDEILGDIDDAIGARLDAVTEASKPKKAAPAKKTTTPAKSRAEKMAPVTRKGSASKPQEDEGSTLEEGKIYTLGGRTLKGARAKFIEYKDAEQTRAVVVLTKAHGDRPRGAKISIPVKSIEV